MFGERPGHVALQACYIKRYSIQYGGLAETKSFYKEKNQTCSPQSNPVTDAASISPNHTDHQIKIVLTVGACGSLAAVYMNTLWDPTFTVNSFVNSFG